MRRHRTGDSMGASSDSDVAAGRDSANDEDLARALHAEYSRPIRWYVQHLVSGDSQLAEDIVQETLLRAWQHPGAISGPGAQRWLFTVAHNLAMDVHRARRARPPEAPEYELTDRAGPDQLDRALESWQVADAMATLSPKHRQVLVEVFYKGKSVAEAAEYLGVPQGTVQSRTYYALHALRVALDEMGVTS